MSAILLAVFDEQADAESVRTQLVRDGFPTDRVELTSRSEKGRAGVQPGSSTHEQFVKYYRTLLNQADERSFAEALAAQVDAGESSTVAVHPRGQIETRRAVQLLEQAGAHEVVQHDLANQFFEHAAAPGDRPMVRHFMPENMGEENCIYCLLFARHHH
ncbi:MAG: hypothetical protein JSR36_07425 [Proteobacteria bacterium]|nr:hypothetical protein [Pseudomonadota bacterium]